MEKLRAAIIGSGNIGTDLLYKARRSEWIDPVWMVGIDPHSDGLARAAALGLGAAAGGVDGLLPHLPGDGIALAFDATSAYAHKENAAKLGPAGVFLVDLTPAAIGPFCIPPVNLRELIEREVVGQRLTNVNMVSCGGQATVPMV